MNGTLRLLWATLSIIVTSALATYVVVARHFFSAWNWLWIAAFALVFTIVFFRRFSQWVWPVAFAWLAMCSFFTFVSTAQALGIGE